MTWIKFEILAIGITYTSKMYSSNCHTILNIFSMGCAGDKGSNSSDWLSRLNLLKSLKLNIVF